MNEIMVKTERNILKQRRRDDVSEVKLRNWCTKLAFITDKQDDTPVMLYKKLHTVQKANKQVREKDFSSGPVTSSWAVLVWNGCSSVSVILSSHGIRGIWSRIPIPILFSIGYMFPTKPTEIQSGTAMVKNSFGLWLKVFFFKKR